MPHDRHITWENFKKNFVQPGDPATLIILGDPKCEVFVESNAARIGLRVPISAASQFVELPYQHIRTTLVQSRGRRCAEASCNVQTLYEPFYAMISSIADMVQQHECNPMTAIQECAQRFFSLLEVHSILSEEKQIGLWCELWVLESLVRVRGPDIVRSWTGPLGEPHDFRFDHTELEVKGTRSLKRSHLISNEVQLLPSSDSDLYLFSLQLAPATGDGTFSLLDQVTTVTNLLTESQDALALFESLLAEAHYVKTHGRFYRDKYKLRTRPVLVPVTLDFPSITSLLLVDALGAEKSKRLSEISFRIDVTGLGFEEVSDEFQSVVRTR